MPGRRIFQVQAQPGTSPNAEAGGGMPEVFKAQGGQWDWS